MRTRNLVWMTVVLPALAATICSGTVLAQSSSPPTRPSRGEDPDQYYKAPTGLHGKTVVLPIGTTFCGRINHTISSTHSHNGERFELVVDSPVLVNGTDVVIPVGSRVLGEVVEAVSAHDVPRQPYQYKLQVHGKLRITVSGLRTPDGSTYPLVGTIKGEVDKYNNNYGKPPLGTSVGYTGTAGSFEALNANRINAIKSKSFSQTPVVMSKNEFLKDEIYGMGPDTWSRGVMDQSTVRSLVLKKRDYYIYQGSPLTIKVMAPFKIGIANPGLGVSVGSVEPEPQDAALPPPTRNENGGQAGGRFRSDSGYGSRSPVSNPSNNPALMPASDGF